MVFPQLNAGFISRDHRGYNLRVLKVAWPSEGAWPASVLCSQPLLTLCFQGQTSAFQTWRGEVVKERK